MPANDRRSSKPEAGTAAEEATGQMPVPENREDVLKSEQGKECDRRTGLQPKGVSDRSTPP
jgi:hypothetical protein